MILNEETATDTRTDWTTAKLFVLIVPIVATVSLLHLWLASPLAWGISTFGWSLVGYWLPSEPRVSYLKWISLSLLISVAASLLAAVL
jgi:hypothetical protein